VSKNYRGEKVGPCRQFSWAEGSELTPKTCTSPSSVTMPNLVALDQMVGAYIGEYPEI